MSESNTSGARGFPTEVKITEITNQAVASAGWAQEDTLKRLVDNNKLGVRALDIIATRIGVDKNADLKKAMDDIRKKIGSLADEVKEANNTIKNKDDDCDIPGQVGEEMERQQRKVLDAQKSLTGGLVSNFQSMISANNPQGVFGSFGSTLTRYSKAMADAGESARMFGIDLGAVGKTLTFISVMYGRLTEVAQSMRQVYAAGILVSNGLTGLVQAASDSGMKFQEFAELLAKNGAVTVTLGTRATMDLSRRFQQMSRFGGDLMMTQQEAGTAFFEVMEMMRVSGEMQGQSEQQLAARGTTLLQGFNDLAIATGRNRDELRKQTADLMRQPLTALMSRLVPPQARGQITNLMANMSAQFGQAAGPLAQMMERVQAAGGGFGLMDENMRPLLSMVPGFAQAIQASSMGIANNTMTGEEAANNMARVLDSVPRQTLETLRRSNPQLAIFLQTIEQGRQQARDATAALEREARARNMTVEQLQAERARNQENMREITSSMNQAQAGLSRLSNAFYGIASQLSGFLVPVIDLFGDGINVVAGAFEILGIVIKPVADVLGFFVSAFTFGLRQIVGGIGRLVTGFTQLGKFITDYLGWTAGLIRAAKTVGGWFTAIGNAASEIVDFFRRLINFNFGDSMGGNLAGGATMVVSGVAVATIAGLALKWIAGQGMGLMSRVIGAGMTMAGGIFGRMLPAITGPVSGMLSRTVGAIPGLNRLVGAATPAASTAVGTAAGAAANAAGAAAPAAAGTAANAARSAAAGAAANAAGAAAPVAAGAARAAPAAAGAARAAPAAAGTARAAPVAAGAARAAPAAAGAATAARAASAAGPAVAGAARVAGPAATAAASFSATMIAAAPGIAIATAAVIGFAGALRLAAPAFEPIGKMVREVFTGGAEIIRGFGSVIENMGNAVKTGLEGAAALIRSVGEAINLAFGGAERLVTSFGTQITNIVTSFRELRTAGIDATTRQITALSQISSEDMTRSAQAIEAMKVSLIGLPPAAFQGLNQFFLNLRNADPAEKLQRMAIATDALGESSTKVKEFSDSMREILTLLDDTGISRIQQIGNAFDRIGNSFRQGINTRQVQSMLQAVRSIVTEVNSLNGAGLAPGAAIPNPNAIGGASAPIQQPQQPDAAPTPVITTEQLTTRTMRYYDESMEYMIRMLEALDRNRGILEEIRNDANSNTGTLEGAINSISGRI